MDGIINQIYKAVTGKDLPMKVRIALRVINGIAIILIYKKFGLDWVIVYSLILVVSDLDSIAEKMQKKDK